MGHVQLVRVGLHIGHELLEVLGGKVLSRENQDRRTRHQPDGGEIHIGLVSEVGIERDGGGVGPHVTHLDAVAVGASTRRARRGRGASGAHDVFDDDRLPERARHVIAGNAGNHIGRPAGGKGHDQGDRTARIIVLRCHGGSSKAERDKHGNGARQDMAHRRFLS